VGRPKVVLMILCLPRGMSGGEVSWGYSPWPCGYYS